MTEAEQAQRALKLIVEAAEAIGWQAGVGAMETAGSIVSYIATRPDEIEKLLAGKMSMIDWPDRWHAHGCLTWQGADGKVYDPAMVRRQMLIKQMEKGA